MSRSRSSHTTTLVALVCAIAACALWTRSAHAQIKEPGNHPEYAVELEPHLLLQWQYRWVGSDGYGLGLRASIPFLQNGPISKINNNMAIGFGLDWAHFSGNGGGCWWWAYRVPGFATPATTECSANDFWVPIVLQWNFFLTPIISVFGEPGLGIEHSTWTYQGWCNPGGGGVCDYSDSRTDVEPVFWAGARFLFSNSIGLTLRLGTPYISAGLTILL